MGTGDQANFDPKAFGPFGPFYQAYVDVLENMGRTYGVPSPIAMDWSPYALSQKMSAPLKAAAKCQLEVMGLANRRTQAYLQAPTRFAQCRSPQDVLNEQMAFWRVATEQYTETSRKLFDTWVHADPWNQEPIPATRDYINFNGTGSKDGGTHTTRPETPASKQRRVA